MTQADIQTIKLTNGKTAKGKNTKQHTYASVSPAL